MGLSIRLITEITTMKHATLVKNRGRLSESNSENRIITDYKHIKSIIEHCKALGLKVVLTQGAFDMIHVGHGRYLKEAKSHGDLLVVGVDSDKKIKHRKGPERPVIPQDERLEMLTHIRHVDLVFMKELGDPKWNLIKTISPDVLIVIKETYSTQELKDLKKYCGKVVVLDRQATTSTSAKIRLLQINTAKKFGQTITPRLIKAIEDILAEVK